MPDLLAKCDWHESTLFLVLPEDPERIAVRRFESRQASSRMYVPEVEVLRLKAENAKLRSQCADLVDERERLFQANVEKNGEVLRLVNENAKLREEIEAAKHDLSLFSSVLVASKFENAKLRELVDYMTPIALYGASEQECDRMRELGAEVVTE